MNLIQMARQKSFQKILLNLCKISKNEHDHIPYVVGPQSCPWNFTKVQTVPWKLNLNPICIGFKSFEFKKSPKLGSG